MRRRVLEELLSTLRAGASFSQALERLPGHFPRIYVAIVQSSERTGDLQRALSRYLDYERKFDHVRKKIVSVLLYPAILLIAGSLVLAFLLFYVVPRFARIYDDSSRSLPLFSSLLMALGGWIERHGWIALPLALAACLAMRLRGFAAVHARPPGPAPLARPASGRADEALPARPALRHPRHAAALRNSDRHGSRHGRGRACRATSSCSLRAPAR